MNPFQAKEGLHQQEDAELIEGLFDSVYRLRCQLYSVTPRSCSRGYTIVAKLLSWLVGTSTTFLLIPSQPKSDE